MATWRRKIEEYEADLYKVQEPTFLNRLLGMFLQTKSGELEMKKFDDSTKEMEIKLHGVQVPDGSAVSVVIDGTAVHELRINRGYIRLFLNTSQGDMIPEVHNGSTAEIRYKGTVLLEGTFRPD